MRIVPLVLAGAAAAGLAWWLSRDQPLPVVKPVTTPVAAAPAPAPVPPAASTMAPPQSLLPESAVTAPQSVPQLLLTVLARIAFPGEKPALTAMVGGNSVTLREGDLFGDGFRLERIDIDRLVAVHVASGTRIERRFDELSGGSTAVAQAPVSAATPSNMPPPTQPPPAPFTPPASRPATGTPSFAPPSFLPQATVPAQPMGNTVNDNPLVGAVLPSSPGKAPPGVEGPKPTVIRPGDPVPAGPKPQPIPPGTPGPSPR